MGVYLRPAELDEALGALARGRFTILAGGTDFYPARVERPMPEDVLDVTGLQALRGIVRESDRIRIGAAVTWSELVRTELPPWFDGLKQAAREIGGQQIQNTGTIVGNVCNASPAADGVPNLLALDAQIELASATGRRTLGIADFVQGNRKTAIAPDELVTALIVPTPTHPARSLFLKLGARRYLVISIVMLGLVIEESGGLVAAARIAIGACSAVAQRLPALEEALIGRAVDPSLAELVRTQHLATLAPIDDVRGTAAYRRDAALTLARRALAQIGDRA